MRQPNHIILDFNNNIKNNSSQYWALNFLENKQQYPLFLDDLNVQKKFFLNKQINADNKFLNKNNKYSVLFNSLQSNNVNLNSNKVSSNSQLFLKYNKTLNNQSITSLNVSDFKVNKYNLERVFYLYNLNSSNNTLTNTLNNSWYNTININFLRKERLYTKLKYSRSPAYDIVSGGAAALLAGLLGFLVSEKFGMELVDSGDFYYLFMYLVFLVFSIRPLLVVAESNKSFFNTFSLNRVFLFYNQIILLTIKYIKSLFKF